MPSAAAFCDKSRSGDDPSAMRAGTFGELTTNLITDTVVRKAVSDGDPFADKLCYSEFLPRGR